jgi:aquaporin Z
MRKYAAEALGTFSLVFAGTSAIVVNDLSGGAVSHVGVSLTFGLIVMAMICAVGDVSGAHLNPAVTLGFFAAGRLPGRDVLPYVTSQCLGALVASGLVRVIFPSHTGLGATIPSGGLGQSFLLETLLTFFLMFVILGVATGARERGVMAGLAIGATVALGALLGGPISGASMNPARSLGPAVVSGSLDVMWLYCAAPLLGAGLAVLGCRCVRGADCCSPSLSGGAA